MRARVLGAIVLLTLGSTAEARHGRHAQHARHQHFARTDSGSIVEHPTGCPRSAFCGCGAAVRVFGQARRDLWLAANWLRFPHVPASAAAPGMAAARRGHVFVIEQVLGNGMVLAYDANSGGHATRIHPRSLVGYTVVNPHG